MLLEEYRLAFRFLRANRKLVFFVAILFFGSAILVGIGVYLVLWQNPELLQKVMAYIMELFDRPDIVDDLGNLSATGLFFANFQATNFAVFYGLMPFLFLPILVLLFNSALIGAVSAMALHAGMSVPVLIASLLPHGIFELPALVLASFLGTRLCLFLNRKIYRGSEPYGVLELATHLLRCMVLLVIPLLLAAAFIEAHITGIVMEWFL